MRVIKVKLMKKFDSSELEAWVEKDLRIHPEHIILGPISAVHDPEKGTIYLATIGIMK